MKSSSIVSLVAFATSVVATWPKEYTTTTEVYVTYTSLCPVTQTTTETGKVYTKTYTTTSTVVDHVPTTIVETVELPDSTAYTGVGVTSTITSLCPITETKTIAGDVVTATWTSTSLIYTVLPTKVDVYTTLAPTTKYIETYVYQTSTSLCPVTETKTISGKPVEVIYTSTSLVVEKIPTTIYETTTLLTTCYATEDVYTTLSKFETYYVTESAGSTISVYITETNTILLTSSYTITKTLEPPTTKATIYVPITLGTSVGITEVVTIPSEVTATLPGSSVFTTIPVVTQSTVTAPPVTVTPVPTPSPTSSAPLEISSNAAPTNGPLAFAIAGAMAMIALA
ncbi:hypothetical protein ONS95_014858 [Cadophora gregata]|uniref:uncharacterized protein n=1 Tax=Cadophora gregata TaxID=51156 RepID=UPI0026DBAD6C|nr:uncharacterized protein ONS95_014858 [Cadophora gregata]KAK0113159.1 hypothetical protein ONS95_014858 [Cadophora gregata]KAK0125200.1 hypothetical protein ONS96_009059 [Cadophora gregata f. sp. sojae]